MEPIGYKKGRVRRKKEKEREKVERDGKRGRVTLSHTLLYYILQQIVECRKCVCESGPLPRCVTV